MSLRIGILAFALLGLTVVPSALAQPPPPKMVMATQFQGAHLAIVTWMPVTGADVYHVYRGLSSDTMMLIGVTSLPQFFDDQSDRPDYIYGVSTLVDDIESPRSTTSAGGGRGGCYVTTALPSIRFDVSGCLAH